jgi:2-oxo-4-hydroxy-4-carboxy--5-ureidoimidazoline (OHCU) decarboxylase
MNKVIFFINFSEYNQNFKMDGILRVEEVNALGNEQFVWIFNNIVESYPQAATVVCNQRPFISADHLADAVSNYLDLLSPHGNNINHNLKVCI